MSKYVMIVCVLITIGHTTSIRAGTNNVNISSEPGNRIDILKIRQQDCYYTVTYTAVCVKKPGIFHFLECLNSNGLNGFEWSHEGYFGTGGKFQARKDSIAACADACRQTSNCVGFDYSYTKRCYLYRDRNDFAIKKDELDSKAYIRCQGTKLP